LNVSRETNAKRKKTLEQEPEELVLPGKALSIRQPWAWAVVNGHKDVENRDWGWRNPASKFRGNFAVHASAGMKRDEYIEAAAFMAELGVTCPRPDELIRGRIVGVANATDFVTDHKSPWFFGPKALVIDYAAPIDDGDIVKGNLGFFNWRPRIAKKSGVSPAKWMTEFTSKDLGG